MFLGLTDCLWVNQTLVNDLEGAMSAPSKLGNRGERNRSKFRAGDVGNAYKGSGTTQHKLSGILTISLSYQ